MASVVASVSVPSRPREYGLFRAANDTAEIAHLLMIGIGWPDENAHWVSGTVPAFLARLVPAMVQVRHRQRSLGAGHE